MPTLPNGLDAKTLTDTQYIHDWVHHLETEGLDIADGGRGKASMAADKDAVTAMHDAITGLTGKGVGTMPYGSSILGEKAYRLQAAKGLKNEYGLNWQPEEILFTTGGQFGLAASFHMVEQLTPGGCIVTPKPWYVNHEELANLFDKDRFYSNAKAQSKFHAIDLMQTPNFKCTAETLQQAIDTVPTTIQAFLFCNPNNPLGTVLTQEEWHPIAKVLRQYPDIPILLDEAFAEIVFDNNDFRISLLHAAPDLKDRTILFRSGTKALGLSGERLAILTAPKHYMQHLIPLQSRLVGNAPLSAQAGMAAALATMTITKKRAISDYYQQGMEQIHQTIKQLGLALRENYKPEGGFYVLADLSELHGHHLPKRAQRVLEKTTAIIENDLDIVMALIFGFGQAPNQGVALIPGSSFGTDPKAGIVRISFSSTHAEITAILNRIEAAISFARLQKCA